MTKRNPFFAVALIIGIVLLPVQGQSPRKKATIEQFIKSLEEAYTAKTMGTLDAEHPYLGPVNIVIEHSLGEGRPRYERRQFKTFERIERWLKSREREEGSPFRNIRSAAQCARGVCAYDFDGGILHNQLYLDKVWYGYKPNGAPYVRKILFLDGD